MSNSSPLSVSIADHASPDRVFNAVYFSRAYETAHKGLPIIARVGAATLLCMQAVSDLFSAISLIAEGSLGSIVLLVTGDPAKSKTHLCEKLKECYEKVSRVVMTLGLTILSPVISAEAATGRLSSWFTQVQNLSETLIESTRCPVGTITSESSSQRSADVRDEVMSLMHTMCMSLGGWEMIDEDTVPGHHMAEGTAIHQDLKYTKEEAAELFSKLKTIENRMTRLGQDFATSEASLREFEGHLKGLKKVNKEIQSWDYTNEGFDELQLLKAEFEVRLAQLLGNEVVAGGGCSGAIILNDRHGVNRAVFKSDIGDVYSQGNPSKIQKLKTWFLIELNKLEDEIGKIIFETIGGKGYIAEELAYKLGEKIRPGLVPPTKIISLFLDGKEVKGSFQLFVQEPHKELKESFGYADKTYTGGNPISLEKMLKTLPLAQFQYVTILHFLMGNFDCHAENIFILEKNTRLSRLQDGKEKIVRIIDAGWSMSPAHPGSLFRINQVQSIFGFKFMQFTEKLPHGEEPLATSMPLIDTRELKQLILDVYNKYDRGSKYIEGRVACALERLEILHTFKKNKIPLKYLAYLNTDERIRWFRNNPTKYERIAEEATQTSTEQFQGALSEAWAGLVTAGKVTSHIGWASADAVTNYVANLMR